MPDVKQLLSSVRKFSSINCRIIILAAFVVLSIWLSLRRASSPKSVQFKESNQSDCKDFDDWPDLEIIVTSPTSHLGQWKYQYVLLPSLALFWPKHHFKLTILTDPEGGDVFCQILIALTKSAMGVVPKCWVTRNVFKGWHKSQWLKFWIDNYVTTKYIAIFDTDSPLVTRVTKYDLFRNGKPIVRPMFGKTRPAWRGWKNAPNTTLMATGYKEVFNCMSYFPVVIKLAHLREFRRVIQSQVHAAKDFNEAFRLLIPAESEYNIMCTLMWNMFRQEYYWIINEIEEGWKGPGDGQIESFAEAGISRDLVRPEPSVAIHWTYQGEPEPKELFQNGICFSIPDSYPKKPQYCHSYENRTAHFNKWEFQFGHDDLSNRTGVMESHLRRLSIIDKCPHHWIDSELSKWK